MINHARYVQDQPTRDGDISAVNVKVYTGAQGAKSVRDRYVQTISHNLGRVPVGAIIILKDRVCDMYIVSSDENKITVKFSGAEANLTMRIW